MKKENIRIEDMTKEQLFDLCVELMNDGAEVQGVEVEEFAEWYKVKW